MKSNILLLSGGGSTEHDVSLVSAGYIKSNIDKNEFNLIEVEIGKDFIFRDKEGKEVELDFHKNLKTQNEVIPIRAVIPCIHGFPGETGDLQSYLEMMGLDYLGSDSEASRICFNKITTKLWLERLGTRNTPFMLCTDNSSESIEKAKKFFDTHGGIFIKASNQGSSVGCYPVSKKEDVEKYLNEAFNYSPFVLVEKTVNARELEVSVFEFDGKIHVTVPGEIIVPSKFYSYEEKYDSKSHTITEVVAKDLTQIQIDEIKQMAFDSFKFLKLRHLSRIDFFLCDSGEIYLNEINTFPGMTPISMFPKMMENYGIKFSDFLNQNLKKMTEA